MLYVVTNGWATRACRGFLRRRAFSSVLNDPSRTSTDTCEPQQNVRLRCNDEQPRTDQRKTVTVSVIGSPNAGKSTLVNSLLRRTICPTSSKVHTTRHNADAVYHEGDTELVFVDTPGIVTKYDIKTYKLDDPVIKDPNKSLKAADVVAFVQDASNAYTRTKICDNPLELLKQAEGKAPLLLILNKIDRVKTKEVLLTVTRVLTTKEDYPKFDDVFMISALKKDGINDLRQYLLDSATPGEWKYPEGKQSNQTLEALIEETVRAKLLDTLVNELPYQIHVKTQYCLVRPDGSMTSLVDIMCKTERIMRLLLRNKKLKRLALIVEEELRHGFQTAVCVLLNVKCKTKDSKP